MRLVRVELGRHDWTALRVMGGTAEKVPDSVLRLVSAGTEDEAEGAYGELENHVVVQGQLFSAAPHVVPALLAALAAGVSPQARPWVLELLYQIVAGESDVEEVERGSPDLGRDCRERAREGVWVLYRELTSGLYDPARSILEIVESDRARLGAFLAAFPPGTRKKQRGRLQE